MGEKIKVVHYINQFYGGYGGEDTASMGIEVKEGPVGPGLALAKILEMNMRSWQHLSAAITILQKTQTQYAKSLQK